MTGWRGAAACRETDPELFFPEDLPHPRRARRTAEAKAVCAGCPVAGECLDTALRAPELYDRHGVFGGLTARERRDVRRRRAGGMDRPTRRDTEMWTGADMSSRIARTPEAARLREWQIATTRRAMTGT